MANIAVINTGGTISSIGEPLSPMPTHDFAEACKKLLVPAIRQACPDVTLSFVTDLRFSGSEIGTLDSTNLQPSDWCRIAGYILDHYLTYDGWVILHGTDSLDFTGGALPFLLSAFDELGQPKAVLDRPVILTGAQVPLFDHDTKTDALTLRFNTDGFNNLCGAVRAARLSLPEVAIFFNQKLMRSSRALKTSARQFDAFSSPRYPLLGSGGIGFGINRTMLRPGPSEPAVALSNPKALALAVDQLRAVTRQINKPKVVPLSAFPASPETIAGVIDALVDQGVTGLVLRSYGEGNFPAGDADDAEGGAVYRALKKAIHQDGILVVNCSQVLDAVVRSSDYAAGSWLAKLGVVPGLAMTPMTAYTKMVIIQALGVANGWNPNAVAALIGKDLTGELGLEES